jgi:hypothetical protein
MQCFAVEFGPPVVTTKLWDGTTRSYETLVPVYPVTQSNATEDSSLSPLIM